jgi:uncharacterized protein DUF2786
VTDNPVLTKIRKLLNLSKSSNVHEAANAAARAQEMMLEHKIEMADLSLGGEEVKAEPIVEENLAENMGRRRVERWRIQLAGVVSRAFNARIYFCSNGQIAMIGRPSDLATVRYLYGYLALEIHRLTEDEWKGLLKLYAAGEYGSMSPPHAVRWKNSFRDGAVHAIREKLAEQRKAQEAKLTAETQKHGALVLVRKDEERVTLEVAERIKVATGGRKGSGFSGPSDVSAYSRGKQRGATISVAASGGALGASKQRLK